MTLHLHHELALNVGAITFEGKMLQLLYGDRPPFLSAPLELHWSRPLGFLSTDIDIAVAIYATMGIAYGLLLAEVVITAWTDSEDAKVATFREAAALVDLIRLAEAFDDATRQNILKTVRRYACTVLKLEWPLMLKGKDIGQEGEEVLRELFGLYVSAAKDSARENSALQVSLDEVDELGDERLARLAAFQEHISRFMWFVLIAGWVLLAGLPLIFDVKNDVAQVGLVLVLALLLALLLFSIWVWDHPFRTFAGISPRLFQRAAGEAAKALGGNSGDACHEGQLSNVTSTRVASTDA